MELRERERKRERAGTPRLHSGLSHGNAPHSRQHELDLMLADARKRAEDDRADLRACARSVRA
jgi:hypothetical protein